ncbi:MAG: hypothetical protein KGJ98_06815, partial [Chloroflexota bacterium]|nr:hypothetical protein [Chloroflexota bacterium]
MRLARAAPLALGLLAAACAPTTPVSAPPSPGATSAAATAPSSPAASAGASARATLPHVFVIVMENSSLERALAEPHIAALAQRYALARDYRSVASPSLPNYLALTSGSTWGITDDGYHALPAGGIGAQLDTAGIPWRAYIEGLTAAGCLRSPYPYALKHDPFAYYGGACPANVVPLSGLASDLAGATPTFVWITPDMCHDGHDCSVATAGTWLAGEVALITASAAWRDGGVLFVTWDESGVVPLLVIT